METLANGHGGGIYSTGGTESSLPDSLINCNISENISNSDGGGCYFIDRFILEIH